MKEELKEELRYKYGYSPLKKVYVPKEEELYKMQSMGINMYKYLMIKAIESLIVNGINYPKEGIFKNTYKCLRENPDIAYGVCLLYPEEIRYSEYAKHDGEICSILLDRDTTGTGNDIKLDRLSNFEDNIGDINIIKSKVINMLISELTRNPRYRFEYKSSKLLEDILSCKMSLDDYFGNNKSILASNLTSIEPAYFLNEDINSILSSMNGVKEMLSMYIDSYGKRYGFDTNSFYEYKGKDILTKPNDDVKRLIRCINKEENNLYNGKIKL